MEREREREKRETMRHREYRKKPHHYTCIHIHSQQTEETHKTHNTYHTEETDDCASDVGSRCTLRGIVRMSFGSHQNLNHCRVQNTSILKRERKRERTDTQTHRHTHTHRQVSEREREKKTRAFTQNTYQNEPGLVVGHERDTVQKRRKPRNENHPSVRIRLIR
jgi:hypothetical protein